MATSFSGGGNRSTRREPPTLGKQLVNFITCGFFFSFIYPFLIALIKFYQAQRERETNIDKFWENKDSIINFSWWFFIIIINFEIQIQRKSNFFFSKGEITLNFHNVCKLASWNKWLHMD